MYHNLIPFAAATVIALAGLSAQAADRSRDEAEIRDLVQVRQQAAWNRHDGSAYAALFAEDGDVVNVVGWWWRGRAEIEQKLSAGFAFVFRDSILTIDRVDLRFLGADVAVARTHWTMKGAKTPPSMPEPREGVQMITVQKRGGQWLMVAFQNTNSLPEVPFPGQPPGR